MQQQNIPCPECSTPIPFDAKQLLSGVQFQCPNCGIHIALGQDAKPTLQSTLKHLEQIKKDLGKTEK